MTPTSGSVTLVNVFTVEPHQQQRLIDVLISCAENLVRHEPGFLDARLHQSLDGTKVTMYAHWRSIADFEALLTKLPAEAALPWRLVDQSL